MPGAAKPLVNATTTATHAGRITNASTTPHRERYVADAVRRKRAIVAELTAYLVEFFRERPCVDCGETDPLVLEFDHLGHKRFNIAKGLRDRNWAPVLDEIAKCDVVCANCHRRRTAHRGGFARAVVAQW
jgi:hypothetical protein